MPDNIKSSTTDRAGQVFLLIERQPSWWLIKNADTRTIKASGDRRYVEQIWNEFVTQEKRAIASNYSKLVNYGIRQAV